MEQLSGLDAAFIHQETRRTPMHVCAVLVYDIGSDQRGAIGTAQLQRLVADRLQGFPLFRRKLRRVLMDVDTPYWVDVARPNWNRHISERFLDAGAGWPEFLRVVAAVHESTLDLSQPPWEMLLISPLDGFPGLPDHCQALVIKVHHAAIDGITLAGVIGAMHGEAAAAPAPALKSAPEPDSWDIWMRLNQRRLGRNYKFAETLGNLVPGVLRAREVRAEHGDLPPLLRTRLRFNDRVGGGRSVGAIIWPREAFVAIRRAVRHVTLNDIALSIVGGALRQYLRQKRQLPVDSVVAGVPISLRGGGGEGPGSNQIATMMVGLATGVADPVERLRLVHRYAVAGKKHIDALGTGTVMDISDSLSPNILSRGIKVMASASSVVDVPVPFHTMVSNVPGPPRPMRLGEAELVVPLGFGPVRDNMGLFHIVSSGHSRISLAFSACDKLLPDEDFYQQCLGQAFTALYEQAMALP
jgi:diacylglycerol O-acyltransferase / wax synthase